MPQGHLDTPLSKTGQEQAKMVGKYLSNVTFHLAISSDLSRAFQTAQAIKEVNPSLDEVEKWQVARERCFGTFQGRDAGEMLKALQGKDKQQLLNWGPELTHDTPRLQRPY